MPRYLYKSKDDFYHTNINICIFALNVFSDNAFERTH